MSYSETTSSSEKYIPVIITSWWSWTSLIKVYFWATRAVLEGLHIPPTSIYNIVAGKNVNSDFSIVTMRRVAIVLWIGSCKKFHAKILIARHFIKISFCLKVVLDSNSFIYKYNCLSDARLMKILSENWHVNGFVSSFSNSYNIRKPNLSPSFKYEYLSLKQSYKIPVKGTLMQIWKSCNIFAFI